MVATQSTLLKSKALNEWRLFSLIVVPICLAIVIRMTSADIDMSTPAGISSMIQFSVRCSVPWLYLAFAASSLAMLFPGSLSRWLFHNRSYIGLCFAAAMAWQLLFILWMVIGYWGYYVGEVYSLYDLAEQVPGYLFLFAMTLTSFRYWRSKLSARQWRVLHKSGIYFIWFVVWTTYWFELYYYDGPQIIDYVFYWAGLLAWGFRLGAWSKKRWVLAAA